MSDRITTTKGLKPGDVLNVAVELLDKVTKAPFWWRSFRVVTQVSGPNHVQVMTLKMHIDPDKDEREIDIRKDVVYVLAEEQLPQGVIAMRMKAYHTGRIKLEEA